MTSIYKKSPVPIEKGIGPFWTLLYELDSVYTFRVLTVLMFGCSERIVIKSWYSVLPGMDSVYTFV